MLSCQEKTHISSCDLTHTVFCIQEEASPLTPELFPPGFSYTAYSTSPLLEEESFSLLHYLPYTFQASFLKEKKHETS